MQKFVDAVNKAVAYIGTWVLATIGGALFLLVIVDACSRVPGSIQIVPQLDPFPGVSVFWCCIALFLVLAPHWIGEGIERTNAERDKRRAAIHAQRERERIDAEIAAKRKASAEKAEADRIKSEQEAAIYRARAEETYRRIEQREAAERKAAQEAAERKAAEAEAKRKAEAARIAALPPRTAAPRPTQVKQLDGEL